MYFAPPPPPPRPPQKILYYNHCLRSLGATLIPKRNNDDAKFGAGGGVGGGVNKVHYGVCENVTVGNDQSRRA